MPFNLITTPWLEIRRASGLRQVLRPAEITSDWDSDPVIALDFPRPDWNAALTEFLIGVLALAMAPKDGDDWVEKFRTPPSTDELSSAFAPLAQWFELEGDGPAAFQDFVSLGNLEIKPLSGLLIDAPGENTLKNNADLFVKRTGEPVLSLANAAAALITLQTYAPSGGAGHRTSLRGGGPLTTLVAPVRRGQVVATLWDMVWANTPDANADLSSDPSRALPWLGPTLTSEAGRLPVTQEGQHPALAFFACPRRIRLVFAGDGPDRVATGYRTQNYGADYLHWRHPLSPYRRDKASGLLPIHPNAGASDYGDWLAWWGFDGEPADCTILWKTRRSQLRGLLAPVQQIQAFGYDMDNMKARQWLEARLPWISSNEAELASAVRQLISGSDLTARAVRKYAKMALYGQRNDSGYRLPEKLPLDALPEPGERLWSETEPEFVACLDQLIARLQDGADRTADLRQNWLTTLRRKALQIFDETVDLDGLTDAEPRRLLWSRDKLQFELADHHKAPVLKALGLEASAKLRPLAGAET